MRHIPAYVMLAAISLSSLTSLGGCALPAMPEPWVKPYERERLADTMMKFGRDGLPERQREHIHAVREGSRGATGVQGSGCGCN